MKFTNLAMVPLVQAALTPGPEFIRLNKNDSVRFQYCFFSIQGPADDSKMVVVADLQVGLYNAVRIAACSDAQSHTHTPSRSAITTQPSSVTL